MEHVLSHAAPVDGDVAFLSLRHEGGQHHSAAELEVVRILALQFDTTCSAASAPAAARHRAASVSRIACAAGSTPPRGG